MSKPPHTTHSLDSLHRSSSSTNRSAKSRRYHRQQSQKLGIHHQERPVNAATLTSPPIAEIFPRDPNPCLPPRERCCWSKAILVTWKSSPARSADSTTLARSQRIAKGERVEQKAWSDTNKHFTARDYIPPFDRHASRQTFSIPRDP